MRWFRKKKRPEVERATAAPGEVRKVRLPKHITNGKHSPHRPFDGEA